MLLKNNMRPAMAGAGTQNVHHDHGKKDSPFTFDFGSFSNDGASGSSGGSGGAGATGSGNRGKKGGFFSDSKTQKIIIIAAAALLAVIIIATIAVVALVNTSEDILYEDNAYMVYADSSDVYHVIANGELLDTKFEGEVTLVPSATNEFAYVFDDGDEGIIMYLLEGKKLTLLLDGQAVDEIVATATLKPGIVYVDSSGSNTKYKVYTEKLGEDELVNEKKDPDHFIISGDAETVVYTIADEDSSDRLVQIYKDRNSEEMASKHSIPVAISNYGDYIYVTRPNKEGKDELYVHTTKKEETYAVNGSTGFIRILEMNIKGDEIIFCTGSVAKDVEDVLSGDIINVTSYLYRYKANEEKSVLELGNNYVTTATVDPSIAIHKNFADTYFTATNGLDGTEFAKNATYYLNKKYEKSIINSKYSGKFSTDGKYFFYIDNDGDLWQLELKDDSRTPTKLHSGVVDYVVTEKNNVYSLSDDPKLVYWKTQTETRKTAFNDAGKISFYNCANKIYFSGIDSTTIYVSEESIDEDVAKLDSNEIAAVPYFTHPNSKKCYAIIYNAEHESYSIYYTSAGNRFNSLKKVDDCAAVIIDGVELDLSDYAVE